MLVFKQLFTFLKMRCFIAKQKVYDLHALPNICVSQHIKSAPLGQAPALLRNIETLLGQTL
jgi:hypothetical protein